MPEMLDALFMGFDRDSLTHSKQLQHSNRAALDAISQKLQVGRFGTATSTNLLTSMPPPRLCYGSYHAYLQMTTVLTAL